MYDQFFILSSLAQNDGVLKMMFGGGKRKSFIEFRNIWRDIYSLP